MADNGFLQGLLNPFGNTYQELESHLGNNFGPDDLVIPGINYLTNKFDITGSSAAQNQFNAQMALNKDAQAFDAQEAQKARNFQYEMRETNYQAMVRDLEKAGLNPYLALGNLGGSGAPSASSASASSGSADMANNKLAAAAGVLAIILRMIFAKH